MNDLKYKKGIKEILITKTERIYAYFRDLPKEEQKRIIEERTEDYYSSGDNWYYELYIQPLWEDEVQLLKEKIWYRFWYSVWMWFKLYLY